MSGPRDLSVGARASASSSLARRNTVVRDAAIEKAKNALPILGALAIDFADLLTLGPVGVTLGVVIGALVTWGVCVRHGASAKATAVWMALGAVYCAVPFTEMLPLATLVALISRAMPETKALPDPHPVRVRQVGPARR